MCVYITYETSFCCTLCYSLYIHKYIQICRVTEEKKTYINCINEIHEKGN